MQHCILMWQSVCVCETEFEVDEGVRVGFLPWQVCVVEQSYPPPISRREYDYYLTFLKCSEDAGCVSFFPYPPEEKH